jgi:hypothetical protein
MATTKLQLYNGALRILGERPLANLTEVVESRYVMDSIWDEGLIDYVLEQGQWQFATRGVKVYYSPDITASFGYQYGFEKPTDFVRTTAVCSDEYFNSPLLRYTEEAGFWFTDEAEMYIKYISNDEQFGGDLSLWPESFKKYVMSYMALEGSERLTQNSGKYEKLEKVTKKKLNEAKSKDAMAEPTKFMPSGSWSTARTSGYSKRDRGSRTSLIG